MAAEAGSAPVDCLLAVLTRLEPEDVAACSLACRSWAAAARSDMVSLAVAQNLGWKPFAWQHGGELTLQQRVKYLLSQRAFQWGCLLQAGWQRQVCLSSALRPCGLHCTARQLEQGPKKRIQGGGGAHGFGKVLLYGNFATFLVNEGKICGDSFIGRPVDVQQLPNGSLLVTDDDVGAVYRITYQSPNTPRSLEDSMSSQPGNIGAASGSTMGGQAVQMGGAVALPVNGASSVGAGAGWLCMAWRLIAAALMAAAVALI